MQALPCPKCGFETEETKSLSMSTRTHKVDYPQPLLLTHSQNLVFLQFGRKQGKEFNGADDDDEDDEGGYGGFGGYGGYGGRVILQHVALIHTLITLYRWRPSGIW